MLFISVAARLIVSWPCAHGLCISHANNCLFIVALLALQIIYSNFITPDAPRLRDEATEALQTFVASFYASTIRILSDKQ